MRRSSERCTVVFVQTPTMRDSVKRDFDIPLEKIRVFTPDPPALPRRSEQSPNLAPMRDVDPEDRLLVVGDPYPHKNVGLAVQGLQELRQTRKSVRLFMTYDPQHPLCRSPGVTGLGRLNREELREAYELACALVMPSIVETVGLPLLEAAEAGVPVLVADRPYAHDVCGDAASYFDPKDIKDFVSKTNTMLGDTNLRRALAEKGRRRVATFVKRRPYHQMLEVLIAEHLKIAATGQLRHSNVTLPG
jgi:glycosyltransferase involved in cell wall biosynthesis